MFANDAGFLNLSNWLSNRECCSLAAGIELDEWSSSAFDTRFTDPVADRLDFYLFDILSPLAKAFQFNGQSKYPI